MISRTKLSIILLFGLSLVATQADELDALDAVSDKPSPDEILDETDPDERPLGDGDPSAAVTFDDPYDNGRPILDSIWLLPLIYQNEDNPYIQEFKIKGRYQWRNAEINSDQGDKKLHENRRARLGATMRLLYNVEIQGEANLVDE